MINMSNYREQLNQSLNQEIEEDPQTLLNRVSEEKIFSFNRCTNINQFPLKFQRALEKVSELKIGQDLLNFFISQKKTLNLNYDAPTNYPWLCGDSHFTRNIFDESCIIKMVVNRILFFKSEEGGYVHISFKDSFVHELLHYKHFLENKEKYDKRCQLNDPQSLINPEVHNGEEQVTMSGIDALDNDSEIVLCENHFRAAWNEPLRFTHEGFKTPALIIEKDIPIDPQLFAKRFERYWRNLSPDSASKEVFGVNIAEPTSTQNELLLAISPFVSIVNNHPSQNTVKNILFWRNTHRRLKQDRENASARPLISQ